ncbi:hypothetical protein ACFLWG_03245 [Chloroflexota bacterium]
MKNNKPIKSITIREKRGEPLVLPPKDDSQFRILTFDEGKVRIYGGMPWKVMRKPLREMAEKWASEHADEVGVILKEHVPGFTPKALMIMLEEAKDEIKISHEQAHGRRDGAVIFHILGEFFRAVVAKLRESIMSRVTNWEVEDLVDGGGIYRIILKGGQDEKSAHNNPSE